MSPPANPIRQQLIRSLADEGMHLALVEPEPEVIQSCLARVRCRALAGIIAGLINNNEPLLGAESDGSTVTVREIGGGAVMCFTIKEGE